MRWTEYPTRRDYQNKVNGTEHVGVKWCDAPKGVYVMPDQYEASQEIVTLHKRHGEDSWYRIVSES